MLKTSEIAGCIIILSFFSYFVIIQRNTSIIPVCHLGWICVILESFSHQLTGDWIVATDDSSCFKNTFFGLLPQHSFILPLLLKFHFNNWFLVSPEKWILYNEFFNQSAKCNLDLFGYLKFLQNKTVLNVS